MVKYGKMDDAKTHIKKYWEEGRISLLICSLCLLLLMKYTWLKWGDLIIDVGREMYIPYQLSLGKLLYRDMFYIYGPFSPYFNSLLFRIFGVHLFSLYLSGFVTLCATAVLIYKISRFFLDVFFSTFAVLTFLIVLAFAHYTYLGNYNFILPYSYSSIHATAFCLAALYFFYLWMKERRNRYAYITSLFILLALLTRIEMGIMVVFSLLAGAAFYLISFRGDERSARLSAAQLGLSTAMPVFFAALVYVLFLRNGAVQRSSLFDIWFKSSDIGSAFANWLSGANDIPLHVSMMLKNVLHYSVLCVLFGAGGYAVGRLCRKKAAWRIAASIPVGLFFILSGCLLFNKFFPTYYFQYRSLPAISLAAIFISAGGAIKGKERTENLFILIISLFSLLMMMRMLLDVYAGHYGFYILVPGIIVYYVFFLKTAAGVLKSAIARRFFSFSFLIIFILFILSHFRILRLCYDERTFTIASRRGAMAVFNNPREYRLAELMRFLDVNTSPKDTLVVFPEGLPINFLLGRENPLYYYAYHPVYLGRKGVEDEVIRGMEESKVDYVVLTQRRTDQYGYAVFGKDYAEKIFKYILENYKLHKQFGPFPFTTDEYGIALFKRK